MSRNSFDELLDARAAGSDEARPDAVDAVHARGELTARERIALLVDEASFVEYGGLAEGAPDDPGEAPADGLVGGVATISSRPVLVASYDPTVHEASQTPLNQRKIEKLIFLAYERRWPFICFAAGTGARSSATSASTSSYAWTSSSSGRFGLLDGLSELSGWVPTVAILSGLTMMGNTAIALLCDFIVATKDTVMGGGTIKEDVISVRDYEEVGDIDLVVEDEETAIDAARHYLLYHLLDQDEGEESENAGSIRSIVPENRRRAYDMRRIIEAIADSSSTLELRRNWAHSMLTYLARMGGRTVGIFANQPMSPLAGAIDPDAADKASRFIELCDTHDIPLVALIDNPGFMIGPESEKAGMARHHARPLMALHHRTVPLYSVQIRKAYGLGPSAMSGFGSSRLVPDLKLAWPSVETGGMSLEGAAYLVKRTEILAAETPEEARAIRDEYAETVRELNAGLRAGRIYSYDDIVDPTETRSRIISMLNMTPSGKGNFKKYYVDTV